MTEQRRTMTTDPKAKSGPIVETGATDEHGNPITAAGSTYLTTQIDGKWYVCNTRGELFDKDQAFDTQSQAETEVHRRNNL
jgi:hypothetical protein